eukprot:c27716_g1_i1 orf=393-2030(+)
MPQDSHQTDEMDESVVLDSTLIFRSEKSGVIPGDTADVHTYSPSELDRSATYLSSHEIPVFGNGGSIKDEHTKELPKSLLTSTIPSTTDVILCVEENKELPLPNPLSLGFDRRNCEFNEMDLDEPLSLDCAALQSKKSTLNGAEEEVVTVAPTPLCFGDHESSVEAVEPTIRVESNGSGSVNAINLGLEMSKLSETCKSCVPVEGSLFTEGVKKMPAMPLETIEVNCDSENSALTSLNLIKRKRESSESGNSTLELDNADLAVNDYPSGECIILNADKGTVNCTSEVSLEAKHTLELALDNCEETLAESDCICSCSSITSSEDRSDSEITEFLQNLREWNGHEEFQGTSRSSSEQVCEGVSSRSSNLPTSIKNELGLDSSKYPSLLKGGSDSQSVSPQRLSTVASSVGMGRNSRVITGKKRYQNDICSFPQKLFDGAQTAEHALPSPYSGQVSFSGPISYSGPISISGRLPYSGQIPYSGSISLRSDSSTTSTHSFAFPILAPEWNSSPIKMPQSDRRYIKRRWWRWGSRYLCCCCCKRPSALFD